MQLQVLDNILKIATRLKASDIHMKQDIPPMFRINGKLLIVKNMPALASKDIQQIAEIIAPPEKLVSFNAGQDNELDFSLKIKDVGRFRVNLFRDQGGSRIVMRLISSRIPSIEELGLPPIIKDLAHTHRGLILVSGSTGSGKSTTLASMIEEINNNYTKHIVTIEDPIEYEIIDKKSLITQRELGQHTKTFAMSLRAVLRQDPDVVLVGEMRDYDTINGAITAAETGHLVLSTIHTIDTGEAINRILSFYPAHQQQQVRHQLAAVLKAVISQRLLVRSDGKGRVPAVEIMINNTRISELIEDPKRTKEIRDAIGEGQASFGMQTFDQAILKYYNEGVVSYDEAVANVSDPNAFGLASKGFTKDINPGESGI